MIKFPNLLFPKFLKVSFLLKIRFFDTLALITLKSKPSLSSRKFVAIESFLVLNSFLSYSLVSGLCQKPTYEILSLLTILGSCTIAEAVFVQDPNITICSFLPAGINLAWLIIILVASEGFDLFVFDIGSELPALRTKSFFFNNLLSNLFIL